MNGFIVLTIIYAIFGTIVALYARKGIKSQEDYFIAGGRVGGVVSALTYAATTYSAFMMVGLVGFTYATGVGAAGFELLYLVGTIFLLSYYAPKVWRISREKGLVSPAELLSHRYDVIVAKLTAAISLLALIPYTSAQLIGVALLFERNGLTFVEGVAVAAILAAIWAMIGGLRSVAWTDAIQGIIMLSAAVLVVIWVYQWGLGDVEFYTEISRLGELLYVPNSFWTPVRFAALATPWFFFALTNPQVFQRLFIPRDLKAMRKMVFLFGFFGFIYTVLVTFLGLELRLMTELGTFPAVEDRDAVTPTLLEYVPGWLSLLVALSILAAAVTTANSIILTLSSMISRDIVRAKSVIAGRVGVLALTLLVAAFAMQRPAYIVELAVLSSTILLCQLPLILGVFHWSKGGKYAGISTLVAGSSIAVAFSFLKINPAGIPASIWVLLISFAVYFVVSAIEAKSMPSKL
jgi:SSS family solute:Na+ symporter